MLAASRQAVKASAVELCALVGVEDLGLTHAEGLTLGPSSSSCRVQVRIRLAKISCSLDNWLIVLKMPSSASGATRNLKAAVCRRRFLTIELALHVLGDLLHYTP